jgi:AP-3 complex subunit delta-1
MCAQETYAHVSNFTWYIDVLVNLAYISLTIQQESPNLDASLGTRLRDTLIDVAARVRAVRPYMVKKMAQLLGDEDFLENGEGAGVSEVLGAAAWICGEYCQ